MFPSKGCRKKVIPIFLSYSILLSFFFFLHVEDQIREQDFSAKAKGYQEIVTKNYDQELRPSSGLPKDIRFILLKEDEDGKKTYLLRSLKGYLLKEGYIEVECTYPTSPKEKNVL
jgi:hypothetical protein